MFFSNVKARKRMYMVFEFSYSERHLKITSLPETIVGVIEYILVCWIGKAWKVQWRVLSASNQGILLNMESVRHND